VSTLGHPELAADAAQALRKLQFDLEDFATALPAAAVLRVDGEVFDVLTDAVALRKRLTFTYHSMERDETAPREVEPYGLVFLTGHWYLIAHDVGVNGMRQFRVSRIRGAKMGAKPQHPDFEVPPTFDLGAYAASRRAWELGNGDQQEVLVAFRGETGLVSQGTQLGEAVEPDALAPFAEVARRHDIRRFGVRRRESFLRWLLSFGGDAWPIAPADTVAEWRDLLVAARRAHANVAVEVA
jgi:proteasome accessory factor B